MEGWEGIKECFVKCGHCLSIFSLQTDRTPLKGTRLFQTEQVIKKQVYLALHNYQPIWRLYCEFIIDAWGHKMIDSYELNQFRNTM